MVAKLPKKLTPDEERILNSLPPDQQAIVRAMPEAGQKLYLQQVASQQQAATIGSGVPAFGGGQYGAAATDATYFQPALGVSGGRRVEQATGRPVAGTYTGFTGQQLRGTADRPQVTNVLPRYFDGDEDMIATFTREQIADIQARMKKAGILGKYRVGVADEATVSAFKDVLSQANRELSDWNVGLSVLQQGAVGGGGGLPYRVSSPDDLRTVIEDSSRLVLGRVADPEFTNRVVKAYQDVQMREQTAPTTVKAPQADVFAEKQIKKRFGAEADAYEFAKFADIILKGS